MFQGAVRWRVPGVVSSAIKRWIGEESESIRELWWSRREAFLVVRVGIRFRILGMADFKLPGPTLLRGKHYHLMKIDGLMLHRRLHFQHIRIGGRMLRRSKE